MDINKTARELMLKAPFYGYFLITLNRKWSERVPTAAVSKNGINTQLEVNADFWNTLTDDNQIAILFHELLHICFFHLTRRDEFPDKLLANIAMDAEINQYINIGVLPEGCVNIKDWPELNLLEKQGTRYYYDELSKALQNNTCPKFSQMHENLKTAGTDWHITWEEFENLPDAEKDLIKRQIDYQLKEIAANPKLRGLYPGEMSEYLEGLFKQKPSIFNWKAYVRRFLGNSMNVFTKKTRRKESNRFKSNPGIQVKFKKHLLVAIDTSGSVSNQELVDFFSEINYVWKTGHTVTIIECDAAIENIYEYKGVPPKTVSGRGGTVFQEVIDYYNEHRNKYTTLIYFTDGECPSPTKPYKPMLWVVSSTGHMSEDLPYHKIKIPIGE